MKVRKVPQRKCIVCQKMLSKKEMVRVVRTPEGEVELDLSGKKNGRGAYMCGSLESLRRAKKQKSLDRALKVNLSSEVYDKLEEQFALLGEKFAAVECERNHES
ncbi:RNase P modulator RnpM [Paenibacillus sp. y28]|uniref:RNase P modulator RnpM n=1 Tax=Paenibacillus sp. y28 TaxID=3129110 RepID=UPI00301AE55A